MTLDRLALGRGPRLVILRRHRRPLLHKGRDRPDFLVVDADLSEARHAGHVDAVLDHPEDHARLLVGDLLEVGRIGAPASWGGGGAGPGLSETWPPPPPAPRWQLPRPRGERAGAPAWTVAGSS